MPGDRPRPTARQPRRRQLKCQRKGANFTGIPKIYFDSSTNVSIFMYKSASITQYLEIRCAPALYIDSTGTGTQCQAEVITVTGDTRIVDSCVARGVEYENIFELILRRVEGRANNRVRG